MAKIKKKKSNRDEDQLNQATALSAYTTGSLIDPQWEISDPNPDIYTLFNVFNIRFFWRTLDSVEVKWSPRMTACAGICTFKGKKGGCFISLSQPLLKLRPRKDLVETLLHEMIHAYLFLTSKNTDRDGHGPEFRSHMKRINKESGTRITIYHSFHDEVKHYQTHWWRCEGPCKDRHPFFGYVKRAMNRAPGPNDYWFAEHQQTCGGSFIKVKEPEGFKAKPTKRKKETSEITQFFSPVANASSSSGTSCVQPALFPEASVSSSSAPKPSINIASHFKSQGSIIHGLSTGTVLPSSSKPNIESQAQKPLAFVPFVGQGHILGSGEHSGAKKKKKLATNPSFTNSAIVPKSQTLPQLLKSSPHLSKSSPSPHQVINSAGGNDVIVLSDSEDDKSPPKCAECPVCCSVMPISMINSHLDQCLIK